MRTSGKSSEIGLIVIPVVVAGGMIALFAGIDVPKTLYGIDQAIRGVVITLLEAVKSLF